MSAPTATPTPAAVDGQEAVRKAFGELLGAERRLRARDKHCGPDELTMSQVAALFQIDVDGETPAGELARAAELSPASVTAMLDHLERNGIVVRRRADHDRRVVLVSLTDRGRAIVADRRARWLAMAAETLDGLSERDLRAAAGVMRRLAAMLDGVQRGQPAGGSA